jgi:hypothetical protein
MALVPFKVNGPSATLGTEERLVQLPLDQPFLTLRVQQRPRESGAMRALAAAGEERQVGPAGGWRGQGLAWAGCWGGGQARPPQQAAAS